jgi:hypothetical protein
MWDRRSPEYCRRRPWEDSVILVESAVAFRRAGAAVGRGGVAADTTVVATRPVGAWSPVRISDNRLAKRNSHLAPRALLHTGVTIV